MNNDDYLPGVPDCLQSEVTAAYYSEFTICPVCCKNMVSITVGRKGHPEKGDVGMCLHCAGWFTVADDKGSLRWATEQEVEDVPETQKQLSWKSHFEITNKRN